MSIARCVSEVLRDHVCWSSRHRPDVPQRLRAAAADGGGGGWYLRGHLGQRFASTAAVAPKTEAFVANIERFVADQGVDLVSFGKHQRKDDITQDICSGSARRRRALRRQGPGEGAGDAHRTAPQPRAGMTYPWIVEGTAMVNHYYFYCVDEDFGPFFLKFCSYFPYNAKLCINGHEYLKRQLARRGVAFEALDNGIKSCGQVGGSRLSSPRARAAAAVGPRPTAAQPAAVPAREEVAAVRARRWQARRAGSEPQAPAARPAPGSPAAAAAAPLPARAASVPAAFPGSNPSAALPPAGP